MILVMITAPLLPLRGRESHPTLEPLERPHAVNHPHEVGLEAGVVVDLR